MESLCNEIEDTRIPECPPQADLSRGGAPLPSIQTDSVGTLGNTCGVCWTQKDNVSSNIESGGQ